MKQRDMSWSWLVSGLLMAMSFGCAVWVFHASSSAAETRRIEYKVIDVSGDTRTMEATLNEYGGSGWELVAVAIGDIQVPRLILKKQE